jgi:hypothetical protein
MEVRLVVFHLYRILFQVEFRFSYYNYDANGCTDTETIIIDEPLVATQPLQHCLLVLITMDNYGDGTGGPVAGTYTYFNSPKRCYK